MFKNISIIAFDLDDTLWPCMAVLNRAEAVLYAWLSEHCSRITEDNDGEALISLRKKFMDENPEYNLNLSLMRRKFLIHLARRYDYDEQFLSTQGFNVFFAARQQVDFYDDVMPSLKRLKQAYRLGSISNGNACVQTVGLGELFEHSIAASDVNIAKPNPLIYLNLAERFAVQPEQILYIGDHPHFDVIAPQEIGFQALWLNRDELDWPKQWAQPKLQISDLNQLESLLAKH